jgi:hypothetical protein
MDCLDSHASRRTTGGGLPQSTARRFDNRGTPLLNAETRAFGYVCRSLIYIKGRQLSPDSGSPSTSFRFLCTIYYFIFAIIDFGTIFAPHDSHDHVIFGFHPFIAFHLLFLAQVQAAPCGTYIWIYGSYYGPLGRHELLLEAGFEIGDVPSHTKVRAHFNICPFSLCADVLIAGVERGTYYT